MSKRFVKMFFRSLLLFSGLLILGVLATGCNGGRNDPVRTPEPASVPAATEEPEPEDFKDKPSDYYTELFRQQIHFSPEKGWINDPNGLIYFNGEYHLFYQYCPENPAGGYMCWGHAVSTDLVHWEELGIAIPYTSKYQIWSGSCVVDENNVSGLFNEEGKGLIAFYTKLSNRQEQCIAYSSDNGRTWQDYNEGKPVLKYTDDPVSGKDKSGNTGFRDPKVVFCEEAGTWLMVVAGDALRIYASDDLLNWDFQISYEKDQTLDDRTVKAIYTECPDLFKMRIEGTDEYKWVLSLAGRSYMVGYVKNISGKWAFVPETDFITMNYGPDAYAGQTYFGTPDGRRILINWMSSPQNRAKQLSWTPDQCGSMTIQTELKLVKTDDGPRLSILPIKEMSQLERINPVKVMTNKPSESLFNGFSKEIYKLDLEIDGGVALVSMYGGAATLRYSADTGLLVFDRTDTGFGGKYTLEIPSHDGKMSMTIYVDIASVEIYADDGLYVASFLTYDTYDYGMDVSYSGSVNSLTVTATGLNSIWRDLRYTKVEPKPLSLPSDIVVPLGQEITLAAGGMRLFTNTDLAWEITEGKDVAEILSAKGGSVNIRGLSEGSFTLKVSRGDETVCGTYTVVEDAFKTNMDSFTAVGTWQESLQKGLTVNSGGDSFYTSNTPFEGNFRMTVKASAETCVAIGLTLGVKNVSAPSGESYVVNFDFNRKDFRVFHFNGHGAEDVSSKSFNNAGVTPEKNKLYTIVLTYTDGHITYEIDGNMVFEDVNVSLNGQYAGIMCYSGAAVFREFTLEELP